MSRAVGQVNCLGTLSCQPPTVSTHGRGRAPSPEGCKTGAVAVYFEPRRFTDGVDDQAQHVAAIDVQVRRWIDAGIDQLAAQAKDRRSATGDDTESAASVRAGECGADCR